MDRLELRVRNLERKLAEMEMREENAKLRAKLGVDGGIRVVSYVPDKEEEQD